MKLTKHNYFKKIVRLYEQGRIPAISASLVDIYHDEWCAIHNGRYCNCDPEIEIHTQPGDFRIVPDAPAPTSTLLGEEIRPLEPPTRPCSHCGSKEFILWQVPHEPARQAISCNECGAVISSTHPLDPDDRPRRRF